MAEYYADHLEQALEARGIDTTRINTKADGVSWLGLIAFGRDGELDDGEPAYTFTVYDVDGDVLTTDGGGVEFVADQIARWYSEDGTPDFTGAPVNVTAEHIWELHTADFGNHLAVLVAVEGDPEVWASVTAERYDVPVITTATAVHDYCDGELDDVLAEQFAATLNKEEEE